MRAARLVILLIRRSPFRAAMLAVIVAVCAVVFSLVSELSRVSQQGLDSAILRDRGMLGSYTVSLGDSGVPQQDGYTVVARAAESLGMYVWGFAEVMPPVRSECPPFDEVGDVSLQVLWERPGVPRELPYGHISGVETRWCIDGQAIPDRALFLPDGDQQRIYGVDLYIHPDYRELVALSTTAPVGARYTVVSGIGEDRTAALREALVDELDAVAVRSGRSAQAEVVVGRIDQDGANVRQAAGGIALVYDVIRWGVLGLSGIALVTVQTLAARQRGWFYGLLTSLGARRRRLALVVALDTGVVAAAGLATAVAVLALADGTIASFAREAFGVEATGVDWGSLGTLAVGIALVALLAAIAPAVIIARRDPLAVLEAPRD